MIRFLKQAEHRLTSRGLPSMIINLLRRQITDTLNAARKNLKKEEKIGAVVHKTPITSEQLQ